MSLIKATREAKGLSQAELARLSAVKQQTISMLETGERKVPRLDTAQKLAHALNCTIDELASIETGYFPSSLGCCPSTFSDRELIIFFTNSLSLSLNKLYCFASCLTSSSMSKSLTTSSSEGTHISNNSLGETFRISHIFASISTSGRLIPCSQFETRLLLTPISLANSF